NDLFIVKPGGVLAFQNVKYDNGNGADTDPEVPTYQGLTFSLVSGPQHGTLSNGVSSSGGFSYTAHASYTGIDTFQYEVSDGQQTATADVIIFIDEEATAEADPDDGAFKDPNGAFKDPN